MNIQEAFDKAQEYLVTRNPAVLEEAIQKLQNELDSPELQATEIRLTQLTVEHVQKMIASSNSVRLHNSDYLADGVVEENRVIRVQAVDQPEASVLLFHVVVSSDTMVVLAPVVE